MAAPRDAEIHKDVQNYYGNVLKTSADLQTNACVTPAKGVPEYIRKSLQNVHEEVTSRYYGCGLVVPERLENCRILDLGSGSGRDCYVLSQLVGEKGHITGIDMTKVQVEVAKAYLEYHTEKFGFQTPNVTFLHGQIEMLAEAGIQKESYDIVISNCVINLVPDKQQVLREVYQVLKEGEAVEVDEETAAVLRNSRFAHDFLFTPVEASLSAPQTKVIIRDPFKLAEESDKMKPRCAPEGAGGCCGKRKSC